MKRSLKIIGVVWLVLLAIFTLLVAFAILVSEENAYIAGGAFELAFGWLAYGARQLPLLRHHACEVALSAAGVTGLFFAVHALGRWRRPQWPLSSSARVTALGIAVVAASLAAWCLGTNAQALFRMPWHEVIGGWG